MFRIHMLPAQRGDALLLQYGDPADPFNILIDGGPYSDYKQDSLEEKAWKSMLKNLAQAGKGLELLVVTHVDSDHIEGAVQLLLQDPLPFPIKEVWFNGWEQLKAADLLGPAQGEVLSTLLEERLQDNKPLNWNGAFQGGPVAWRPSLAAPFQPLPLAGGMQLTLVSPTPQALVTLRPTWEKEVKKAGLVPGVPVSKAHKAWPKDLLGAGAVPDVEAWASAKFTGDSSKANGSSIAFMAEYEGKSCLFAADARPTVLLAGLKSLLKQRGQKILELDAFKLPHHGSRNNLNDSLLKLLDSRRYLISSNGNTFNHPDSEALARIALRAAGQPGDPPVICFNYTTGRTEPWDNPDLKDRYHFETEFPEEGKAGLVIDL